MKQHQETILTSWNLPDLNPDDILFIVPLVCGARIFTSRNVYRTIYSSSELLNHWKTPHLVRCHTNYIINPTKIEWFTDHKIHIGNRTIPIGPGYLKFLMDWMRKFCLNAEDL